MGTDANDPMVFDDGERPAMSLEEWLAVYGGPGDGVGDTGDTGDETG